LKIERPKFSHNVVVQFELKAFEKYCIVLYQKLIMKLSNLFRQIIFYIFVMRNA